MKKLLESINTEKYVVKNKWNPLLNSTIKKNNENNILPIIHPVTFSYTQDSKFINKPLWNIKNTKKTDDKTNDILHKSNIINMNLDAAKPIENDMYVYSGLRRDPQELVKESGGILHHPTQMSTSINPESAIKFARSNGDNIRHVLKIKLRKGQKVGAYLGMKSEHPHEHEFLMKSNQLLDIHPEFDDHTDKYGNITRVHHAIVMEPHEYEHLSEHGEVKSHKEFSHMLNNVRTTFDNKLNRDIDNNIVDSDYIRKKDQLFNKEQLDKLVKNPNLHNALASTQLLHQDHITQMLNDNVVDNQLLAAQPNLNKGHIQKLISNNEYFVHKELLNNNHIHLDKDYLDTMSSKKGIHNILSKSKHALPEHIDNILDNVDDDYTLENLARRNDLNSNQIKRISAFKNNHANYNLSTIPNLHQSNISDILTNGIKDYRALSTQKNLSNDHITHLLKNFNYNHDEYLQNILRNHSLTQEHKDIINNSNKFSDESKAIINNKQHTIENTNRNIIFNNRRKESKTLSEGLIGNSKFEIALFQNIGYMSREK